MALISALACGGYAIAADPSGPPASSKRQAIKICMSKEMAADKGLSYINATKTCLERVNSQIRSSAVGEQTIAGNQTKE